MFGVENPKEKHIKFEVWDPDLGCVVLGTLKKRMCFEVLDPDPGWLVLESLKKLISFEVCDPDLGCLVLEPPTNNLLILRFGTQT